MKPDILVDVTDHGGKKLESIHAFGAQFDNPEWENEPQTYISSPEFIQVIEARAREYGKSIGVKFAEGFISRKILGVNDLFDLK